MNKKVLLSLVMVVILAIGAGLGTFAWFTSQATSTNGVFEAGTLNIDVNGSLNNDKKFEIVSVDKIAPNDELAEKTINIENKGNLNLAMFKKFSLISSNEQELEDAKDLAKQLLLTKFHVKDWSWDDDGIVAGTSNWEPGPWANEWDADNDGVATLYDLISANHEISGGWTVLGLKPLEKQTITIGLKMNKNANNDYQGLSATLGMEVVATQVNEEAIDEHMATSGLNLGIDIVDIYLDSHF